MNGFVDFDCVHVCRMNLDRSYNNKTTKAKVSILLKKQVYFSILKNVINGIQHYFFSARSLSLSVAHQNTPETTVVLKIIKKLKNIERRIDIL